MIHLLARLLRQRCPGCRRSIINPRRRGLCAACVKRLDDSTRRRYRLALLLRESDPGGYWTAIDAAVDELRAVRVLELEQQLNGKDHT
jgi:predicted amidophosphoribosyltransferase